MYTQVFRGKPSRDHAVPIAAVVSVMVISHQQMWSLLYYIIRGEILQK